MASQRGKGPFCVRVVLRSRLIHCNTSPLHETDSRSQTKFSQTVSYFTVPPRARSPLRRLSVRGSAAPGLTQVEPQLKYRVQGTHSQGGLQFCRGAEAGANPGARWGRGRAGATLDNSQHDILHVRSSRTIINYVQCARGSCLLERHIPVLIPGPRYIPSAEHSCRGS